MYSPFEPVAGELDYPSDPTSEPSAFFTTTATVGHGGLNATPLTDGHLYPDRSGMTSGYATRRSTLITSITMAVVPWTP